MTHTTKASLAAALERVIADAPAGWPTLALLIPVSSRQDFQSIRRPPHLWVRNRARRKMDPILLAGGFNPQFHYSTYEDHRHTNRGDIAIRRASIELLDAAFHGAVNIVEIGWSEFELVHADWIDSHIDLFVVGGGGYYFLDAAGRPAPRIARDLAILRKIHCPIASLAPGINGSLSHHRAGQAGTPGPVAEASETFGEMLRLLQLSSARDASCQAFLNAVGPAQTVMQADPALFLQPAMPSSPPPELPPGELAVGLNLAFHQPDLGGFLPKRLHVLATAARALARDRACKFFYFVHSNAERVIPSLLRQAGVRVTTVDLPAEQMLVWYKKLDIHICQMLHSSILSINAGVPTINLAYDIKNPAFFDVIGLSYLCVYADSITSEQLFIKMTNALARGPSIRLHLAERKRQLRQSMDDYLAELAALAHRSHAKRMPANQ